MLKAEIIGNLGADAELRQSNSFKFVSFNVADTYSYTDSTTGAKISKTTWVNCVINWDAKNLLPYLRKGVKVYVRGSVRLRCYMNNQHQTVAAMDINVEDIELCGGRQEQAQTDKGTEQVTNEYKSNEPF